MMNIRHPVDIYMTDKRSDATCVTLQVLYMFGRERRPFDLAGIDRRIGRASGESHVREGYILELLRQGLTLTAIESFDVQAMLGPNGYEYTHRFLSERQPALFSIFTPERFVAMQEAALEFWQQVEQLPGTLNITIQDPAAQDISHLLSTICDAVIIPSPLNGLKTKLAYETDVSGAITFYVPQLPTLYEPLRQTIAAHAIDPWLGPYNSIIGVSS